jgi:hypothetical protein
MNEKTMTRTQLFVALLKHFDDLPDWHQGESDEGWQSIVFYVEEGESSILELSDYEKGYLTAYYETDAHIQNEHSGRDEDNLWYGIQVGERMFDLCVWKEEGAESEVCVVYECYLNDGGFWNTDTSKQWFLKEGEEG